MSYGCVGLFSLFRDRNAGDIRLSMANCDSTLEGYICDMRYNTRIVDTEHNARITDRVR